MDIKNYIWYEKHRPDSFKSLALPKEQKKKFISYIKEKNIPHLLLHGPQGSGKTTTGLILKNSIPSNCLMLNASSNDRGVGTVKGKIKQFASSQGLNKVLNIVFLDEADGMTPDALLALKNTMEKYSETCRFILTANNVSKIIPPIQSRCTPFEFTTLSKKNVLQQLTTILEKEKVSFEKKDLLVLIKRLYPDIRSIINNLQAGSMEGKFSLKSMLSASFNPEMLGKLLDEGKLFDIRSLCAGVLDFTWLYKYLFDQYIPNHVLDFLDEDNYEVKVEAVNTVAEHLFRDATIADKEINFADCCVDLMLIMERKIKFK